VRLSVVVLVAGGATLATEISASRLLAPYFGSSTVVWANVIGLILIYLSAGYWIGGRVADRRPSPRLLGWILLVAAAAIAVIPFVARPFLSATVRELNDASAGVVVGSFLAALALFAIPVTLLGAVSPFVVRLALPSVESAGTVAGRLYALSTIGSIVGTFMSALVTIPLVGTQRTMIGAAVLVVLAGALLLGRRWQALAAAAALLLLVPPGAIKAQPGTLYQTDSRYQYFDVRDVPGGGRVLELNEGVVANSVWYRGHALTGGEWDMFLVLPPLRNRPLHSVLVLGNAAGSTARGLAAVYPGVRIDGVEIDPAITAAARRWFALDTIPNLHVITADARAYLLTTRRRYDLICIDAYRQPYIPFQLSTREFFEVVRNHLTPGGIVALNVSRVPGHRGLVHALARTVRDVFGNAWTWDALRFNSLVFASDPPLTRAQIAARAANIPRRIRPLAPLFRRHVAASGFRGTLLTDDRAPVEWIADRGMLEYVARGGRFDEHYLPTAP
jgi:spermidine synthase